jgi:hypothetical protein
MNPLLGVAISLVPDLIRLIAGDSAGKFSEKIAAVVQNTTATSDDKAAQAKVDADPQLKAQLQKDLVDAALNETKEQNRAEEVKRSIELEALKEQLSAANREREDALMRFREELKSTEGARNFYDEMVRSGSAVAWINPFLSVVITIGFIFLVYLLLFYAPKDTANNQVFNIVLGALATAFATVIGFHFGSSSGSKQKDNVNTAIMAEQAAKRDEQQNPPPAVERARPHDVIAARDDGMSVAAGSSDVFDQKAPAIMKALIRDVDITDFQAGGVLGNIGHECAGFRHFQEIGIVPPKGGWGWCQWTGPRRRAFEQWASQQGHDFKSDEANYGFLVHELHTTEQNALLALKKTGSLQEATKSFMDRFERPGAPHLSSRLTWAARAMKAYQGA